MPLTMIDWALNKFIRAGLTEADASVALRKMREAEFADVGWWSLPEWGVAAVVKALVYLAIQRHAKEFLEAKTV